MMLVAPVQAEESHLETQELIEYCTTSGKKVEKRNYVRSSYFKFTPEAKRKKITFNSCSPVTHLPKRYILYRKLTFYN